MESREHFLSPTHFLAEEYLNNYLKDQALVGRATILDIEIYGIGPIVNSVRNHLDGIDRDIELALQLMAERPIQSTSKGRGMLKVLATSPSLQGHAAPLAVRMVSIRDPFLKDWPDEEQRAFLYHAAQIDLKTHRRRVADPYVKKMGSPEYTAQRISALREFQKKLQETVSSVQSPERK